MGEWGKQQKGALLKSTAGIANNNRNFCQMSSFNMPRGNTTTTTTTLPDLQQALRKLWEAFREPQQTAEKPWDRNSPKNSGDALEPCWDLKLYSKRNSANSNEALRHPWRLALEDLRSQKKTSKSNPKLSNCGETKIPHEHIPGKLKDHPGT